MTKLLLFTTFLFLSGIGLIFAQEKTISGKIVSTEKAEPLVGVAINIKGTTKSTATDIDGNFSIKADEKDSLVVSYIGFQTQTLAVGSRTQFDIVLKPEVEQLDEVVVVGYGVVKKSDLTGAVTSLKASELTKISTPDPIQMLQGRAAGVQITNNSGEPGAGMKIRIRGTGTINNSNPLYVIDGFQTDDPSFLNPADIETMEILKDASATAIYGSRGANGVVLITTKKNSGDDGKVKFQFDASIGFQELRKKIDMVNASQYAQLQYDALRNDNNTSSPLTIAHLDFLRNSGYKGTDWQEELTQRGIIQQYNLNVMGGNKSSRWGVSGSFFDQQGTLKNSGLKKYFFRANYDMDLAKWLKGGVMISYARTDKTNTFKDIYGGSLTTALIKDPAARAWDPNIGNWGQGPLSGDIANPARVNYFQKYNKYYDNYFVGNTYLEATIIQGLTFKTNLAGSYKNFTNNNYSPTYDVSPNERNNLSRLYQQDGANWFWLLSNYLTYNKTIKDHTFTVMAGIESQENFYSAVDGQITNVPEDRSLRYFSAASGTSAVNPFGTGSYQGSNALQSYFTRANYSFKNLLKVTATLRHDGSSKFAPNKRFGTFPSIGVAFNVSELNFMKNLAEVSNLKARVGYGQVGNQGAARDYPTYVSLSNNYNYSFNGVQVPGFTTLSLGNPSLIWENTETWNAGIDLSLFRNSLTFTADYYVRNTKDMILPAPVAAYLGSGGPDANIGTMRNSGIELVVSYKGKVGKFNYEVGGNFTANKNEITYLGDPSQGAKNLPGGAIDKVDNVTNTEVGREVAYFYGLKTDGIFNTQEELDAYTVNGNPIQPNAKPGDVKFVDLNGDGVINNLDKTYLGSAQPKFFYGLNASIGYGGFDLGIAGSGVYGSKIVNGLNRYMLSSDGITNSRSERLDAWTPENPNSNEPRMTFSDPNQNIARFSDRYIEDGSFFRIQNLTLGYTIPQNLSTKFRVSSLRVFIASDNLYVFNVYKGWDPEIGGGALDGGVDIGRYPLPRTYRTGLTLKF